MNGLSRARYPLGFVRRLSVCTLPFPLSLSPAGAGEWLP